MRIDYIKKSLTNLVNEKFYGLNKLIFVFFLDY